MTDDRLKAVEDAVNRWWPRRRGLDLQPLWNKWLHEYDVDLIMTALNEHRADEPDAVRPVWKVIKKILAGYHVAARKETEREPTEAEHQAKVQAEVDSFRELWEPLPKSERESFLRRAIESLPKSLQADYAEEKRPDVYGNVLRAVLRPMILQSTRPRPTWTPGKLFP